MSNKIALIYENKEYSITVNEKVIEIIKNPEEAFIKYQQVIKNNAISSTTAWDYIVNDLKEFKNVSLDINEEFKTLTLQNLKYFQTTNKAMYITNDAVSPLVGGYTLFRFIAFLVNESLISDCQGILQLCKLATDEKVNYRIMDTSITFSSAIFNYGMVEYDFRTEKINKGILIEKCSFEQFKEYVYSIINV